MYLLELAESSVSKASKEDTKLTEKALKLPGMSSKKVRGLLNHLVSGNSIKYLEIGVWKGSTLYSALEGNSPVYAVAIDNWSEFGGPKTEFQHNLASEIDKFTFFDSDSFKFDKSKLNGKKFNVYFYDGKHEAIDQEMALTYYVDCMEEHFIYICDDWNWEKVKTGTRAAVSKCNLEVIKEWELPAAFNGDLSQWWNGLYVAVFRRR